MKLETVFNMEKPERDKSVKSFLNLLKLMGHELLSTHTKENKTIVTYKEVRK
jgi:hypothetical protein